MKTDSTPLGGKNLKGVTLVRVYPALRQLPPAEWDEAPRKARGTNFDLIEWIGLLAGIAFVTYLLRFDANQASALSLPVRYLVQFFAAVPLLVPVVGPFYLRRTRRGLDHEIERRANAR